MAKARPKDGDDAASRLPFEKPLYDMAEQIQRFEGLAQANDVDFADEIRGLRRRRDEIMREIYSRLTPWQRIMVARHPERPQAADYIEMVFDCFTELHGDMAFRDDPAITCGFAMLDGMRVLVIGQRKGRDTKESVHFNWGYPHPEGYRKALLKMKLAEKFGVPIVTLIDTKGAYPGVGAEERGQSGAIARNLMEMAILKVPVVCVILSEGGSGGALGIGVGDRMLMFQNAYYSVIAPEGCAAILWKDASRREEAAQSLKITADDLYTFGIVDEIIPEPGAAHLDPQTAAQSLKDSIAKAIRELSSLDTDDLLDERYKKLRMIGIYREGQKNFGGALRADVDEFLDAAHQPKDVEDVIADAGAPSPGKTAPAAEDPEEEQAGND